LASVVARREPARLLIVGTYRPVEAIAERHPVMRLKQELLSKRHCVEVALEGLDDEAIGAYLKQRFPTHRFPAELVANLHAHTSGNPLFLLNALSDFEERGWLRERDGAWECTADPARLGEAVPESTRDFIAFRLDQLPGSSLELLQAASVAGMSFSTQAL